jgi:predicted PurR-regulated permease PerM
MSQTPAPDAGRGPTPSAPAATPQHPTRDLIGPILGVLALLGLIAVSVWVVRPFLAPTLWAATIVIATWPMMRRLQGMLLGNRLLASIVMSLAILLLFFVPLGLAIGTIVENADEISDGLKSLPSLLEGELPGWIGELPLVGPSLANAWKELGKFGLGPLLAKITPYAGTLAGQALKQAGVIGALAVEFLTTVLMCAVLYATGESASRHAIAVAHRLGGERGERTALLAAASVRGVALGVVVTAVVQSVLAALGLLVVGVPGVTLLTAIMVLLSIAQLGTLPVLIPVTIWLFWSDQAGWGIAMGVWSVIVATMDNVLRPWLIRQGADLPLLLIMAGVIGGLVAFGLIGLFIGPVVLAVTWTLMQAWIDEDVPDPHAPRPHEPPASV